MSKKLKKCCPCCFKKQDPELTLLLAIKAAREAEQKRKQTLEQQAQQADQEREDMERAFEAEAARGVTFIKHGRQGKPHPRAVCVRGEVVDWGTGRIEFDEIFQVVAGKQCDVLRDTSEDSAPSALCFSIMTKDRSLALQASSTTERDRWVAGVTRLWKASLNKNSLGKDNVDDGRLIDENDPAYILDKFCKMAESGVTCVLHQRDESPVQRSINLYRTDDKTEIVFVTDRLNMSIVTDIIAGKKTDVLLAVNDELSPPELCFSIITSKKITMDIQMDSNEQRNEWVDGLRLLWHSLPEHQGKELASSGYDEDQKPRKPGEIYDPLEALARTHAEDKKLKDMLVKGAELLKHGRHGAPHFRHVFVDCARAEIHYTSGNVPFAEVLEVIAGKHTQVFRNSGKDEKECPDAMCFSVVSKSRTLDLQCTNVVTRDIWVKGLNRLIQLHKEGKLKLLDEH